MVPLLPSSACRALRRVTGDASPTNACRQDGCLADRRGVRGARRRTRPRPALLRAEHPVAGVAEARDDVAVVVEVAVDGRRDDRPRRDAPPASARSPRARRAGTGTGCPARPASLSRSTAAAEELPVASIGSTTMVSALVAGRRHLEVVLHRLQRLGVAVEPDEADPRRRDQVEDAVEEAVPGPQDRHQRQLLALDDRARPSRSAASRSAWSSSAARA